MGGGRGEEGDQEQGEERRGGGTRGAVSSRRGPNTTGWCSKTDHLSLKTALWEPRTILGTAR
eukprot:7380929-Pyramimonas_sp.AAC.1